MAAAAALAGIVLLSGCGLVRVAVDQPRYFVLSSQERLPDAAPVRNRVVGINRIEVPEYLDSRFLVVRRSDHEIHFREFDRWGEGLGIGMTRVLGQNLRSLGVARTILPAPYLGREVDFELVVRVLRAEGRIENDRAWAEFAALWELRSTGRRDSDDPQVFSGHYESGRLPWDGRNYTALAEALSEGILGLSQEIGASLP